ncbi:MAG: response regulator [Chloroflexi bacterium]|nr:response regulator [Chloroflexota bacterium]
MSESVAAGRGQILVVDDSHLNRLLLGRALEAQEYTVTMAEDGRVALELLLARGASFDVVLLDLLMPEMDGYEALAQIKADPALRHIPVVMISAVEDLASVVRCLELGATDYLLKPFNAAILRARISGSLASKRLRDLELEYLDQVGRLTAAAAAIEAGGFEPESLNEVVARPDALGQLARIFQQMAREVRAREERLQRQVRELRIEVDEANRAREVAEITGTDYFRKLKERADELRSRP